jgi:RNA polymerase sigma factor (sigma-70 family)
MRIIKRYSKRSVDRLAVKAQGTDVSIFTDEQLWEQFISGSKAAFEHIYYIHINLLYDYAIRLSKDEQLSEDCVQDLFTTLWENQHNLPLVNAVKSYLLVSLKRRVYRKLSEHKKDINKIYEALEPGCSGFDPEPDNHAESTRVLQQAFTKLSEKQKEVIYLRFYNQLSYEEIAEVMEVKIKAIYKLIARAIHTLRNSITHPIVGHLLLVILAS